MQGKGILDQNSLKQCSLDTLQKIRAQAVIAPSCITSVATNQFQPTSGGVPSRNVRPVLGNTTGNSKLKSVNQT